MVEAAHRPQCFIWTVIVSSRCKNILRQRLWQITCDQEHSYYQRLPRSVLRCIAKDVNSNTRMLVTFGICFKHFDTRYLVFYNTSPPRMFLYLDLPSEYRIQHGVNGPLYVASSYSTWIFCRGVSGFATDCPCGVWCRGLTTCLLHVGPPFGNRILNNSWAVGLT